MKILKVYPLRDHPKRYNYHINYGVWDKIEGDSVCLETFNADLSQYDTIFLPMHSRWDGHMDTLNRIKNHKIRKVLFDNDSCYRGFDMQFYIGMDFIFYRGLDKWGRPPMCDGDILKWSIDTDRYTPVYGGSGISFNCSVAGYKLRNQIEKLIKRTRYTGDEYIEHLQNSAAAIHTDSDRSPVVRAKILEFAACGTQIISNRVKNMGDYFPDDLIIYFDTINQLNDIILDFKPDIRIQKQLREIVEQRHTDTIRAKQIIEKLCE